MSSITARWGDKNSYSNGAEPWNKQEMKDEGEVILADASVVSFVVNITTNSSCKVTKDKIKNNYLFREAINSLIQLM